MPAIGELLPEPPVQCGRRAQAVRASGLLALGRVTLVSKKVWTDMTAGTQSCDFTAHMCTGRILFIYKLLVNPLFKIIISIEHVIIGSSKL